MGGRDNGGKMEGRQENKTEKLRWERSERYERQIL